MHICRPDSEPEEDDENSNGQLGTRQQPLGANSVLSHSELLVTLGLLSIKTK